jgi:PAS domain S-box-containing protein
VSAPRKDSTGRHPATFEDELRRWADAVGVMVTRHGVDGVIHYVSDASRDLIGYAPEEIVGEKLGDLLHPDDATMLATGFGHVPERTAPASVTFRMRRSDGTYTWLEVTAGVLPDVAEGPSPQIVSVLRGVDRCEDVDNRVRRGRLRSTPR